MRASEFSGKQSLDEDLSRRDFLKSAGAAAGLGALGYGAVQQKNKAWGDIKSANDTDEPNEPNSTIAPRASSPEQLKKIIIDVARDNLPENQVIPFVSQAAHETHDFNQMSEVLAYSATRLTKLYPRLFPAKLAQRTVASAERDQIIANTIYGGRMGNGDFRSGDGYRYRGRGYIMLTGKENYERFGRLVGADLVNNPDLAADPELAAKIAIAYWKTRVSNRTNTNNIRSVTKNISGSSGQGIKSRVEKMKQYTRELTHGKQK